LVIGLLARGFRLLSDEYALVAADGSVTAFPRALAVKPGSYAVVAPLTRTAPPADGTQWHLRPQDLGSCFAAGAHRVAAVVAPTYSSDVSLLATPMGAARVVECLGVNIVNRAAHADGGLRPLARAARGALGASLTYGSLHAAVDWVLAATATDPARLPRPT
jgi:hypothetical protein